MILRPTFDRQPPSGPGVVLRPVWFPQYRPMVGDCDLPAVLPCEFVRRYVADVDDVSLITLHKAAAAEHARWLAAHFGDLPAQPIGTRTGGYIYVDPVGDPDE